MTMPAASAGTQRAHRQSGQNANNGQRLVLIVLGKLAGKSFDPAAYFFSAQELLHVNGSPRDKGALILRTLRRGL